MTRVKGCLNVIWLHVGREKYLKKHKSGNINRENKIIIPQFLIWKRSVQCTTVEPLTLCTCMQKLNPG